MIDVVASFVLKIYFVRKIDQDLSAFQADKQTHMRFELLDYHQSKH